jgi:hypothetical protein
MVLAGHIVPAWRHAFRSSEEACPGTEETFRTDVAV